MAKEIFLTPLAKSNINSIVEYLIENWNGGTAKNFLSRLEKMFSLISSRPEAFVVVNKAKGIKRCLVTKQNMLYFIETDKHIKVITIFDTRQNPQKLKRIM